MTKETDIFRETDLVGLEGQRESLQIYTDWQVRFNNIVVDLNPEAAICLSAIISNRDKLLGTQDREKATIALHHESVGRGMMPTEIVKPGTASEGETRVKDSVQKSSEYLLLRRDTSYNPYLFALGYVGAKRIFLCSNVQNMDYGLQIIHDFFESRDDAKGLAFHEKDFATQYRIRKQSQPRGKKTEVTFDDAIKKAKITQEKKLTFEAGGIDIIDPLRKRHGKDGTENVSVVDTADTDSLERVGEVDELDIIAELLSKYTPLQEYKSVLKDFITELPVDSILQESDLLELASSFGHTPNPADIDRVILECKGLIKKTFIGGSGRVDIVAFKRFSTS